MATDQERLSPKSAKHNYMPLWLWHAPRDKLPYSTKHFLSFIWFCTDRGCREWDYRLAARFEVTPRTIQRWTRRLLDLRLINVQWTRTRNRTIYRMPFFRKKVWQQYYISHKSDSVNTLRPPRDHDSANVVH